MMVSCRSWSPSSSWWRATAWRTPLRARRRRRAAAPARARAAPGRARDPRLPRPAGDDRAHRLSSNQNSRTDRQTEYLAIWGQAVIDRQRTIQAKKERGRTKKRNTNKILLCSMTFCSTIPALFYAILRHHILYCRSSCWFLTIIFVCLGK